MLTVVPNMYVPPAKGSRSHGLARYDVMSRRQHPDSGRSGDCQASRLAPTPPGGRFHFRAFLNSWSRSERKDFVQSMQIPSPASSAQAGAGMLDSNPFGEEDETLGFLNSVHVLPKSDSSGGYDVYRTPTEPRRSSSGHNVLTYSGASHLRDQRASRTSETPKTPNSWTPSTHAIGPRPEFSNASHSGRRFSKNIGNPALRKKTHEKLVEATRTSELYRSTSALSDAPPLPSLPPSGNISNSRAVGPSKTIESTTFDPPSFGSSTPKPSRYQTFGDYNDLNSGYYPGTPNASSLSTPPKPKSVVYSGTDVESFHESLVIPSHKDSRNAGNNFSPNSYLARNRTPGGRESPVLYTQSQQVDMTDGPETGAIGASVTVNQKPGFLALLKRYGTRDKQNSPRKLDENNAKTLARSQSTKELKVLPKLSSHRDGCPAQQHQQQHQHYLNTQRCHERRSGGHHRHGSGQFGRDLAELECSCKFFHTHRFDGDAHNNDIEAIKERRQEIILASMKAEEEHTLDKVDDPRIIFWLPTLSFHPYTHGDSKVKFSSLWPRERELREHLQNSGIQQTVLKDDAVLDLCTLAVTCGPLRLLRCLIDLQLIRVDQLTENGSGLLHLAVLAQNRESVQFLMSARISPKIRDRHGLTADQVCFHPGIRKQMAPRYTQSRDVSRDKILLQPSLQDKDTIFKLANNPKDFVDIQKKLQTLDFNVNTECDNAGDFLLHIAVRKGLAQLPLLMALVKIQGADIELCNADGMTPLMLTAAVGNCVLCDVLICLFGADPNKPNPQSGQSALHYAAEGNHRKTVECLIRRGADVNIEAHDGLRPDDIPACLAATDDCREIIAFNRVQRLEMLSELVRKGEVVSTQLLPSDLCVVDSDGHTLVMVAAIHNRFQTLHNLLEVSQATINAQHSRTGMTVLGIAAQMGNVDTISVLLRHDANPTIADMNGYLPLHHAVLHNHEHAVDVFLDHFPKSYVGLHKAVRLCKKTSIHLKLKAAWEKRQEEIVTPKMLGCALNGDAGELFLLLDEGDNINPKSGTGNWPLYLAVENGHLDVLKLLCERGGDIRKRHPTTGATALHVAAKMGHQTIVSYLLGYCRQSIESKSMFDSAPALNAAGGSSGMHSMSRSSSGFIKSPGSQRSLDSPEKPREYRKLLDINAVDRDNKTALQLAAERGYSRIVELLLFHGATTAMLDAEGQLVTCRQYEGVRIMIESHRQQHTRQVIKCVMDKSRKALALLQQIWLPKFDHHLRNKEGDTPLMVAAATGRLPIIRFLLESAVYPEVAQYESDCADDSDADSGVLDPTSSSSKDPLKQDDEFQTSHDVSSSIFTGPEFVSDTRFERASSPQVQVTTGLADSTELFYQTRLSRIVNDANRPKGLSIYHDGLISHVCAVNLTTGYTALHHAVRGAGDIPQVLSLLLEYDPTPINVQDNRGETAIHLACKLGRKKCVEMLLARSDIDLNVRTLEGHLPEEVANLKTIHKMIERQRMFMPAPVESGLLTPHDGGSIGGSDRSPSITGSTVNFEKVHSRYEALKQGSALDRAS